MACTGDGWHLVGGNCRVLVQDREITYCQTIGRRGEWTYASIKRWDKDLHTYRPVGRGCTLAALRAGIKRGTMTIS